MGTTPTIKKTLDTRMNTGSAGENIFSPKNKKLIFRILGITEKAWKKKKMW